MNGSEATGYFLYIQSSTATKTGTLSQAVWKKIVWPSKLLFRISTLIKN